MQKAGNKVDEKKDIFIDIDDELENLIEKYQLDEYYPCYRNLRIADDVIRRLSTVWGTDDKIACVVIGDSKEKIEADKLHFRKNINIEQQAKIDFISFEISESYKTRTSPMNYMCSFDDFKGLGNISWEDYQHVYIISNIGANVVGFWFRNNNVKYICLYDWMIANGLRDPGVNMEYYQFVPDKRESKFFSSIKSGSALILWEIYEQSQRYQTYSLEELKLVAAKKIFFLGLVVRNFTIAEKWKDIICSYDGEKLRYEEVWYEIKLLLKKIEDRLKERKKRDVFALWIDHTEHDVALKRMPFVSSLSEKSIWFENLFTITGFTRETVRTLFTAQKLIEDKTNNINEINEGNSPLLKFLEENGYKVDVLGEIQKIFPYRYRLWDSIYKCGIEYESTLFWDGIRQLLTDDRPHFVLIHCMMAHPPCLFSEMNDREVVKPWGNRKLQSYKELDQVIEFYINMLGEEATTVIFSDHGGSNFWPRQHVFLSVYGKNYIPQKIKEMCSNIDFYKIIKQVVEHHSVDVKELRRDYVEIQGGPQYSLRKRVNVEAYAAPAFEPPFRGYRGVVTQDYVYIHFAGGREWLSRRDVLQPRPSWYVRQDDIYDASLLPKLREMAGVDYGHEPAEYGMRSEFYLSSQNTLNENFDYNYEKIKLLNSFFSGLKDKSVALYMGNRDSREVYLALSMENRRKIVCIINKIADCICADLDVPIVSLENIAKYDIHTILVNDRALPSELKNFLQNKGQDIHVFGLYGWFEVNGYHTKHNFYDFVIQSRDVPLSSPTAIPDFLHYVSSDCTVEVALVMVVQDEKTLLARLHGILKQMPLGIRIYCLDSTGKAAGVVKDYQKVASAIEIISVDGYASLSAKLNELLSSVKSKYIFFLSADEYLHAKGLYYLHEITNQTGADVAAAGAVVTVAKKGKPGLAEFSSGNFELKREARLLSATYNERYGEWEEREIPSLAGSRLYRVDFLRRNGIHFLDIKSGWKDIFCLQTIFGAPKYVKAVSPVCISVGVDSSQRLEAASAEYARDLVGSMFAYQHAVEMLIKQWHGFGNSPALCDKFRERAMTIFDQQYFSGLALDDEMRKTISQTVQEELQKNPSIGMWWIKYLFMRSSFPVAKN